MDQIGLVVIGRNEGDRLRQCLESAIQQTQVAQMVYVDSGSTDGSAELARSLGSEVIDLDLNIPFTAARARNAGFARLKELHPQLEYVQFVDGDCELAKEWLDNAYPFLVTHPDFAVVCGRRRERYPERSRYNALCDMEWNTPIGETQACGGDSLMRISALEQVGGFNPQLIAGEEPELCQRLRNQGWKIYRLEAEMTLHDADMAQFSQWWKRAVRSGYAFAAIANLHPAVPQLYERKQNLNIWLWGLIVPLLAIGGAWLTWGWSLLLLLGYGMMSLKIYLNQRRQGFTLPNALNYTLFCMLGRFPQLQGQFIYYWNRWQGKRTQIIEYKLPSDT